MSRTDVRFVPYRQPGEPERRAGIAPVELSVDGLSDGEIQALGHLCAAADEMNPIFRQQFCRDTAAIVRTIDAMLPLADGSLRQALDDYRTILHLQNGPWSMLPRKNNLIAAERREVERLASRAHVRERFRTIARYLFEEVPLPDTACFYPAGIDGDQLDQLGDAGRAVNTLVQRTRSGRLQAVRNEEHFRLACSKAAAQLRRAREFTQNISFRLYLDAKIEELATGSEEARRLADYHWIRHDSPIDIIISTALEVYLDHWRNAKGSAAACVTLADRDARQLLDRVIGLVPELEAGAPWTHRRTGIDPAALPRLRFVQVAGWSGDYVTSPMTTLAQSLPNDEWVGKNVGTVNLVYRNTGRAAHAITGSATAREFLTREAVERWGDQLFEAGQIFSALHEIGHTTGRMAPDRPGEPRDYLQAAYSAIEECRAELFAMYAAGVAARRRVIPRTTAEAGHHGMLLSMLQSLRFEPQQAHIQARTMMWHWFDGHGVVQRAVEGGRTRFQLKLSRVDAVAREMLRTLADIKAAGDREAAGAFLERWCRPSELKPDIEHRLAGMPLGRGLIFPELRSQGDRFLPELVLPGFLAQRKFSVTF